MFSYYFFNFFAKYEINEKEREKKGTEWKDIDNTIDRCRWSIDDRDQLWCGLAGICGFRIHR